MVRQSHTVNVRWTVQVYAQHAAGRKREDEYVVCDFGGHEFGGDGELQRDALDVEHGQRSIGILEVGGAGRRIAGGSIKCHGCRLASLTATAQLL
jgi:hypothetical protein